MSFFVFANIYDSDVVEARGLRTLNSAAWNRVLGLAAALGTSGGSVEIISTGISASPRRRAMWHKAHKRKHRGTLVRTNAAVGFPALGICVAPILQAPTMFRILAHRRKQPVVLFYNYSVMYFVMMIIFRVFGIKTCMDLEDITTPPSKLKTLGEWRQLVRWAAMRLSVSVCHSFVIPAASFASWVPTTKPRIVCRYFHMRSQRRDARSQHQRRLSLLYSGPYTPAHGSVLVLQALRNLHEEGDLKRYVFNFTGCVPPDFVAGIRRLADEETAVFHGLLDAGSYQRLLGQMDVGLALQLASGRYGLTNVPSKAYEYIAAGMVPIVTNVGDFASLLANHVLLLGSEDGTSLRAALADISARPEHYAALRLENSRFARAEWDYEVQGERLLRFLRAQA